MQIEITDPALVVTRPLYICVIFFPDGKILTIVKPEKMSFKEVCIVQSHSIKCPNCKEIHNFFHCERTMQDVDITMLPRLQEKTQPRHHPVVKHNQLQKYIETVQRTHGETCNAAHAVNNEKYGEGNRAEKSK